MKKLNIQYVSIALIGLIGVIAVYYIVSNRAETEVEMEYPYVTSIHDEDNLDNGVMGVVGPVEKNKMDEGNFFSYDTITQPPIYLISHSFLGLKCGQIEYSSEFEGDTLIVNENHTGDCSEEVPLHINTTLTDTRSPAKIKLNKSVNGESVGSEIYEIDPDVPQTRF